MHYKTDVSVKAKCFICVCIQRLKCSINMVHEDNGCLLARSNRWTWSATANTDTKHTVFYTSGA
jgi:hypothetical protein